MNIIGKYQKFDYRVQLMRIFACLIVIGCHIRIEPVHNDTYNSYALLFHGFFDDGVAIFFAIMGFFIGIKNSDDEPVWKYMVKTFLRVLVPVLILMVIISFLSRWISGEARLGYCFAHPQVDYKTIIKSFISLNWGMDTTTFGHLWYISSYLQLIVAMPLIRLLTLDNPYAKKARKWILLINVLAMVVGDMKSLFRGVLQYITAYEIFGRAFTFVLIGYSIYSKRDFILKHKNIFRYISLGLMLGINVVRFLFQSYVFSKDITNTYFYYWSTGISLIFVVSFICFFLSFMPGEGNRKIEGIVGLIGSCTFMIYLIHKAVIAFIGSRGIREALYSFNIDTTHNPIEILVYDVSYPLLIFVISLVVCILPTVGYDLIKNERKKND